MVLNHGMWRKYMIFNAILLLPFNVFILNNLIFGVDGSVRVILSEKSEWLPGFLVHIVKFWLPACFLADIWIMSGLVNLIYWYTVKMGFGGLLFTVIANLEFIIKGTWSLVFAQMIVVMGKTQTDYSVTHSFRLSWILLIKSCNVKILMELYFGIMFIWLISCTTGFHVHFRLYWNLILEILKTYLFEVSLR